jgi:hypothetical protein
MKRGDWILISPLSIHAHFVTPAKRVKVEHIISPHLESDSEWVDKVEGYPHFTAVMIVQYSPFLW